MTAHNTVVKLFSTKQAKTQGWCRETGNCQPVPLNVIVVGKCHPPGLWVTIMTRRLLVSAGLRLHNIMYTLSPLITLYQDHTSMYFNHHNSISVSNRCSVVYCIITTTYNFSIQNLTATPHCHTSLPHFTATLHRHIPTQWPSSTFKEHSSHCGTSHTVKLMWCDNDCTDWLAMWIFWE